jgi:hypothetical protein
MSDTSLRARGVSEIVDAAFALYRRHALQYIVVTAIATAPSLILSLWLVSTPPATMADLWKMLPGMLVSLFTYSMVSAVVSRMGSDVYLGAEPDIGATVRQVVVRVPTLLGAMLLTAALIFIAALFFLVPAVFVFIFLFATVPIIVLEKKGVFAAMARSKQLTRGRKAHVFGTLALLFGIYIVFSIGFTMGAAATGNTMVQLITSSLFSVVASPLVTLGVMVLYYDLRIRAEGFDLEHMAQALGGSPLASSMGASPT